MDNNIFKKSISIIALVLLIMPFSALAAENVTTYDATDITDNSATFQGSFTKGKETKEKETWWGYATKDFNWRSDFHYSTGRDNRISGEPTKTHQFTVTGLYPNTTYWYNFCFKRTAGTDCGNTVKFTTLPPPDKPLVTANVSGEEVQSR